MKNNNNNKKTNTKRSCGHEKVRGHRSRVAPSVWPMITVDATNFDRGLHWAAILCFWLKMTFSTKLHIFLQLAMGVHEVPSDFENSGSGPVHR